MGRALSSLAALTAALVCLGPPRAVGAAADRVVAILRLKLADDRLSGSRPHSHPLNVAEGTPPVDAWGRDGQRAARDRRLVARLDVLGRGGRARLRQRIEQGGGRVIYALPAVRSVVAEVAVADLEALRRDPDVEALVIDEPRQAHIEIAAQALGAPAFWSAGYRGGATDVAVVDTGLYVGHAAFASRSGSILSGVFHDTAQLMSNYWDSPTDPDDFAGHGTFVSGVIFSQGDPANPGRRGLAPGLDRLYNIKAGYLTYPYGGSSLLSDLMAGVDWALTRVDPPEVFNYSYGARVSTDDDYYTQFWDGIVDTFEKTATISAGNGGPASIGSPGMAYNVLSVANVNHQGTAIRDDDAIAASSSGGPTPGGRKKPDLAAPGTSLVMPSHYGPTLWSRASGTSFSAPAVAGVAALIIDAGVADPRAVKALLINSADAAPGTSGWDPRLGWGYVNATRAFDEREAVVITTLTPSTGESPVRFFERATPGPTKATAAWHRHVTYETGGWPAAVGLSNLDLLLYSRDDGTLRSSSSSAIDNVEQAVSEQLEAAVLAIVASTPFFTDRETIALAHSGGFVARTGPRVAVTLSESRKVSPGTPFSLTAYVSNPGDLKGHGYEATVALPAGYVLVRGTPTQTLDALDPGASRAVSWIVQAPEGEQAPSLLAVSAVSRSYGFEWRASANGVVTAADGCGFVVTPVAQSMSAAGESIDIRVDGSPECAWAAMSEAAWLTPSPGGGQGSSQVTLAAAVNPGAERTAVLSIAGQPLTVTQAASPVKSYYLAEGTTRAMFTLEIAVANPNDADADVRLHFLRTGSAPVVQQRLVPARSRFTIRVDDVPGLESSDVSTIVESLAGLPLAVERTMTWDGTSYGGHGGAAVESLSTTWYFAEGAQGFFDTYLLLANPGDVPAQVDVAFLREGRAPVERRYAVDAHGRTTVFAGDDDELVGHSFAMVVTSDAPIVAERSMYWSAHGRFWDGGHESSGVPAPATSWFLAEGATGAYFDEYVLVGNPGTSATEVHVRWLLPTGETIETVKTVGARARLTIDVEQDDPRLADTAVSAMLTASAPVVVERAMYWPGGPAEWHEAHNAFGATETATRWALAEGRVGTLSGYETYVLLANPTDDTADVRVTFLRESGAPVAKSFTVSPRSRMNVVVVADSEKSDAPELADERFGALVEVTNGVGVVVERAMYWDTDDRRWAAGTNVAGIPLR